MNKNLLSASYWCCILASILSAIIFFISIAKGVKLLSASPIFILPVINIAYQAASIIISFGTLHILANIFKTKSYNWVFYIWIFSSAILMALEIIKAISPVTSTAFSTFFLVFALFLGIVYIIGFYKMMNLENPFGNLWKRFCLLNLIIGFCIISILFNPIAFLINAVSCIFMAVIFKKSIGIYNSGTLSK
jgi:hypothetical protein